MTRLLFGAELPLHPWLWGVSGVPCLALQHFLGWLQYLQDHVCAFQACWHMFWDGDVAGRGRVSPVCRRTAVPPCLLQEDVWHLGSL